jgi:putative membrane protein
MDEGPKFSPKPRVFRLDDAAGPPSHLDSGAVVIEAEPDIFAIGASGSVAAAEAFEAKNRRGIFYLGGFSWVGLLRWALGLLFSLWIGTFGWHFIENLFETNVVLGWIAAAAAGAALLALGVLGLREWLALAQLDNLAELRQEIMRAVLSDHRPEAQRLVRRLIQLYQADAASSGTRAELEIHLKEIIDGPDLLRIAERLLLKPRDEAVKQAIAAAARRVSLVTTLSPRALVDILFVAAQAVRLTRLIVQAYGGRPGTLGFLRLGRKVLSHLAITGGIAITDGVLSQVLGAGLAAKLSAKLGEGVLNGILTARIGLAAIAVCRPMPFISEPEPKLAELVSSFARRRGADDAA